MVQSVFPVDVICYTAADGQIRPLRIRLPEKDAVGQVCEILQSGENHVLGAESVSFLCRIRYSGMPSAVLSELKYTVRSRSWVLSRPGGSFSRCASGFRDVR